MSFFKKIAMNYITLFLLGCLAFSSCKKSDTTIQYKGEVSGQPNYCTSSTGFPFVIKYVRSSNIQDSLITITLPVEHKFIGQKIEFNIRNLTSQDERIVCDGLHTMPKQVVIFNVKPQ